MRSQRVIVVGGGVAGLTAAYRIRSEAAARAMDVDVQVLEASAEVGGKIATVHEDGFLCETGPNGFLDNEPATLRLIDDLGLKASLQRSTDTSRRRYLVRKGKLVEMHMNPVKFMRSPLLSFFAKIRMAREYWIGPKLSDDDETIGDFGRRRLGREFSEVMLDSMVSGIYAGDVDRLSLASAFPKITALEKEHGGLIRGMMAKRRELRARKRAAKAAAKAAAARGTPASVDNATAPDAKVEAGPGGVLHSFRGGMGEPIEALAASLGRGAIRTDAAVARIEVYGPRGGYTVHLADGERLDVDAVVVALPAPAASQVLRGIADEASAALSEIEIAGVHVACLGFRSDQVRHSLEGFGALIPRREKIRILGSIFSSSTFEGRAPKGYVLLTNMIGGRHDPQASELDDDELLAQVLSDLRPLLGIEGEPVMTKIVRWARGIPQYELGHIDLVERARADVARRGGLFLGGNSIVGVSLNQCVAHAETLGREVCDFLAQGSTDTVNVSREEGA